jgi:hypothetical protein
MKRMERKETDKTRVSLSDASKQSNHVAALGLSGIRRLPQQYTCCPSTISYIEQHVNIPMSRRLDLSQFRGDDSEEEAESFVPKVRSPHLVTGWDLPV